MMGSRLSLSALAGVPAIDVGDDLAAVLGDRLEASGYVPAPGDVLVVTHKIVSKAEGRTVDLAQVEPSDSASRLAIDTGKPAAFCEIVLRESRQVLKKRKGLIIAEHRLGMVMANAGIDRSNVDGADDEQRVLLLPEDPDRSAGKLADAFAARFGQPIAVVICDSVGRAWRQGVVGLALGAAGLPALLDLRGRADLDGRPLDVTQVGLADQIASAAELLMGEADEGQPAVLVQGLRFEGEARPARDLLRPAAEDLFR
ncbi:MAG: coenzyme F420-0:L-glutamate ligase [Geminicoccaceae bacterium]